MARIRTIKPEFWTDEELSSLPEITHLLAAGLLCYADDEGYFNANPGLVKAAVFPLRKLPENSGDIPEMFSQLKNIGYLRFGTTSDGKRFGQVVNFSKHQKISHLTKSKIKTLEISWEDAGEIPENSGSLQIFSALNREQGTGKGTGNREGEQGTGTGKGTGEKIPPTPASGGDSHLAVEISENLPALWWKFYDALKGQFGDVPTGHPNFRNRDVKPGCDDWESCFRDWKLYGCGKSPAGLVLQTSAPSPHVTEAGLAKYRKRIRKLTDAIFGCVVEFSVAESP